jgi:arylsulfatase A-like enzyme
MNKWILNNKMVMLMFTLLLFTGVKTLNATNSNVEPPKKDKRPNIIFLLTDDQRYNALGCMGNNEIETPHIDKLAEKGVLFTNHYDNTAICMGSRATIMTGLYEHKSGCNFTHGPLSSEKFQETYPVLLRKSGYYTGFTGKFGYAVKEDEFQNSSYAKEEDMPKTEFDWWKGWPSQGYYQTSKNKYMVEYAEKYPHVSTALGAASIDFIKAAGKQKKPFCLSVSFKAPHSPVSPDPKFNHVYEGKTFTKPVNFGEEGAKHLPEQSKKGRQYQKLGKKYISDYDHAVAQYYQLVYGIDKAVGMLYAELEKQNLLENTIIIYTTDNGYYLGAHAFGGKVLPYEEGSRAPLIVSGPEKYIKNIGSKNNALTGTIDMMPTILDYAGVNIPENVDGVSLKPILDGKAKEVKEHQKILQVWGSNPTQCLSIVSGGYKYLYWFYGGEGMTPKEELYNLNNDPYEMNNLATNSKYNKQLEKLRGIYDSEVEKWKKERIEGHAYEIYDKLFDRSLAWSEKDGLMKPEKDNSKKLAAKEAEKAKRKTEKKNQGKKNKKNK